MSEDDDDDPVPIIADWSSSRYSEIAVVSTAAPVFIPAAYAGQRVFYVATNPTSDSQAISFPSSGTYSSAVSAQSVVPADGGAYETTRFDTYPRAIRGYPGQHEPLNVTVPAGGGRSANVVGQSTGSYAVDDQETFDIGGPDINATLRSRIVDGAWSINIWLVNGDVDSTDASATVSTAQTDALAQKFMTAGTTGDIFGSVTSVFGDPWGSHGRSEFIDPARKDIHVLLYDIENDGVPPTGEARIAGYFSSKDSYVEAVQFQDSDGNIDPTIKSNARLMFYIDSALFADDSDDNGTWEITGDYWPAEMVSTLAHEFQHMIQYYQRNVVLGQGDQYDTWLNEMSSVVAEDLAARYIGVPGPRGVSASDGTAGSAGITNGRLPRYNVSGPFTPVATWSGTLEDYSASYSFGAYLVRTFGSDLFQQLLTSVNLDENASATVTYTADSLASAANAASGNTLSFTELMRRWGVAMIVSDDTDVPSQYRINAGNWIEAVPGGTTVGSINAYNYRIDYTDSNGADQTLNGPGFFAASSTDQSLTAYTNTFFIGPVVPAGGLTATFSPPTGGTLTILTEGP